MKWIAVGALALAAVACSGKKKDEAEAALGPLCSKVQACCDKAQKLEGDVGAMCDRARKTTAESSCDSRRTEVVEMLQVKNVAVPAECR